MKQVVIKRDRMCHIPMECVKSAERLHKKLTVPNGAFFSQPAAKKKRKEIPQFFNLLEIDHEAGCYLVPRNFDYRPYLKPNVRYQVSNTFDLPYLIMPLATKTPKLGPNNHIRYNQKPAYDAMHQAVMEGPGHKHCQGTILALGCGKGKTVLGLMLAEHITCPTIVVCHTIQMMHTWKQCAVDLFGVCESRIGFIGGGDIDWEGKDLVFCTMAGMISRDYPEEFWKKWGLALLDEGDLLGATELSYVLPKFYGRRVLLTATVRRADGNEKLYYHHVGDICFEDTEADLKPRCVVLDSDVPRKHKDAGLMELSGWNPFLKRVAPHIPKTISKLATFQERHDWAYWVVKQYLGQGRKILFLGERVDELLRFNKQCKEELPSVTTGLALGSGRMKAEEVDHNLKTCDIVWGIQQIAKRGLNEPSFDTLIIQYASFTDVGRLKQTVGRVLRYQEGKKEPVVVILNDPEISCLSSKTNKLTKTLASWGYDVEWY